MANSLTIIECDRCCAFQRYDACEPWTSHECSIDRWGTEGGAVSWWVIDRELGGELDTCLRDFVPEWISSSWPFREPRFIGRDLLWADWLALPEIRHDS